MIVPKRRKYRRTKPPKRPDNDYIQLWRIVDGAIMDAFKMHPEYIAYGQEWVVRQSITKRIVGVLKGYAEQSAQGRSGGRGQRLKG